MKPYLCFGVCNTDGGAQRESEEHQRSQAQKEPPAEAGNHRPTDHGGDQGETRRAVQPPTHSVLHRGWLGGVWSEPTPLTACSCRGTTATVGGVREESPQRITVQVYMDLVWAQTNSPDFSLSLSLSHTHSHSYRYSPNTHSLLINVLID